MESIQWLSPNVRWGVSWSTPRTKSGLWKKLIVSKEFRAKVVTNLMSEKLVGAWDYEWKNIVKKLKNPSLDLTQDPQSLWQHRKFIRVLLWIMLWRIITWWIGTTSGVLDREEDPTRRWIKEAIWIRKSMPVLNRDEGGYQLSHIYDSLITIPTSGDQSSWWRWRMSSKRRST